MLRKIHVLYSIVQPPGIRIHKHRLRGEARKLEREGGGRGGKRRREREEEERGGERGR